MPGEKRIYLFDPKVEGRRAECEGGLAEPGATSGHRDFFAGRLSGHCFIEGEPPLLWRWYLMTDFTEKPEEYEADSVWCEETFLFIDKD